MASAKQQKLRQLMKEKKALSKNTKVDSPIARYNSLGQLSCAICNIPVKSNTLWTAHVQSKKHKETIALLKAQKDKAAVTMNIPDKVESAIETTTAVQRDENEQTADAVEGSKRFKVAENESHPPVPAKAAAVEAESVPADMEEGSLERSHDAVEGSHAADDDANRQSLPADFFDNQQTMEIVSNEPTEEGQTDAKTEKGRSDSSSQLPQGFFDDPKIDAKVRKVEYKDPELEEWEKFKKSIIEENKISDGIMDVEDDEAKVDREITELTEQSECYSKAELLRLKQEIYLQKRSELKRQQQAKSVPTTTTSIPNQTSDSEDEQLEEFLNWRSKVV